MSRNQHVDNALDWMNDLSDSNYQPSAFALKNAQIEASLAIAYEQRTANLIAFYGEGPVNYPGDPAYAELNREIVERLGLK